MNLTEMGQPRMVEVNGVFRGYFLGSRDLPVGAEHSLILLKTFYSIKNVQVLIIYIYIYIYNKVFSRCFFY